MSAPTTSKPRFGASGRPAAERGTLFEPEYFWRDIYGWLRERGYQLRPRYDPNWIPSWKGSEKMFMFCEDGQAPFNTKLLDAKRTSDGKIVMLKLSEAQRYPNEPAFGRFFSTEPLASDARNHCIPIYDILSSPTDPGLNILVMPLLRYSDDPKFDTVGEAMEYLRQTFEGLLFMHELNIAHRDVGMFNMMMDATPLYPEPYHPYSLEMKRDFSGKAKHYSRTLKPVKYYLTDFGVTKFYEGPGPHLDFPLVGAERSVPEYLKSETEPCDPFAVDVYCLGNMAREMFLTGDGSLQHMLGFEFLWPLVENMVQDDPVKRPKMKEAMAHLNSIIGGLSSWKLRSQVLHSGDSALWGFLLSIPHWWRRIGYIIKRIPALPIPNSPHTSQSTNSSPPHVAEEPAASGSSVYRMDTKTKTRQRRPKKKKGNRK